MNSQYCEIPEPERPFQNCETPYKTLRFSTFRDIVSSGQAPGLSQNLIKPVDYTIL